MIIVVPLGVVNAGTMNNMLFPLPMGMTAITGLSPYWMACMAGSWTPQNCILGHLVMC